MKKVLMSIHPKWCEKIFNGEKTIEVRKIAPKIDTPKELSEFYMPCKWYEKGDDCGDNNCPLYEVPDYEYGDVWHDCEGRKPLTRAPQSWCYVEV